jgi:tRNA pseudouridine55 synthase
MIFDFQAGEVLLFDKPIGWTSFDVVNKVRYLIRSHLGIKKIKVGHAGTLDPLATGLLILCTGKFTKRIQEFQDQDKEYTGTFFLGATTPSFDKETEIDKTYNISHITDDKILNAAKQLTGDIEQIPPLFSAIKIKGKRAYDYARKNKDVKLNPRKVSINEFEITGIDLPKIYFRVSCSKGTYIRSLARDFGEALNAGAYLTS